MQHRSKLKNHDTNTFSQNLGNLPAISFHSCYLLKNPFNYSTLVNNKTNLCNDE